MTCKSAIMPNPYGILQSMEDVAIEHEPFALAVDDPYLSALIGTIEEPQGSSTAGDCCTDR